jgi:hypothetical protein
MKQAQERKIRKKRRKFFDTFGTKMVLVCPRESYLSDAAFLFRLEAVILKDDRLPLLERKKLARMARKRVVPLLEAHEASLEGTKI